MLPSEDCWECRSYCFYGCWATLSHLMRPSEDCWECSVFVFCCRLWATLSYVMRPSEDCWECRMYCVSSLSYFEQHWVILCTHLRTAWSAECSNCYRLWATLSHLMLPSEDCDRCFHESNRSGCDVELLPLGGSRWILRAKIGIGVLTGAKLGTGFHTGAKISDRSGKQGTDLASQGTCSSQTDQASMSQVPYPTLTRISLVLVPVLQSGVHQNGWAFQRGAIFVRSCQCCVLFNLSFFVGSVYIRV